MLASLICTGPPVRCGLTQSSQMYNILSRTSDWDLSLSSNFQHRTPSLEPLAPFQLPRLKRRHNLPARLGPNAQSILVPSSWNGTASYLAADKTLMSNHLTIGTDVL